jgi:uncharacterized protein (TIGR00369 family)
MTQIGNDGDVILIDGPDNTCFGCSPFNERGLRMVWRRIGLGEVEAHYTVDDHWGGAPGIVHGGIQAALLDETMGVAIHHATGADEPMDVVTARFELDYRRPVPTGEAIVLWARRTRQEGRRHFVQGEIRDRTGEVLTSASALWIRIASPRSAGEPAGR